MSKYRKTRFFDNTGTVLNLVDPGCWFCSKKCALDADSVLGPMPKLQTAGGGEDGDTGGMGAKPCEKNLGAKIFF